MADLQAGHREMIAKIKERASRATDATRWDLNRLADDLEAGKL